MEKGDLVSLNFGGVEDVCTRRIGIVVDVDPHFETRTLVLYDEDEGVFSIPTHQPMVINDGW